MLNDERATPSTTTTTEPVCEFKPPDVVVLAAAGNAVSTHICRAVFLAWHTCVYVDTWRARTKVKCPRNPQDNRTLVIQDFHGTQHERTDDPGNDHYRSVIKSFGIFLTRFVYPILGKRYFCERIASLFAGVVDDKLKRPNNAMVEKAACDATPYLFDCLFTSTERLFR